MQDTSLILNDNNNEITNSFSLIFLFFKHSDFPYAVTFFFVIVQN